MFSEQHWTFQPVKGWQHCDRHFCNSHKHFVTALPHHLEPLNFVQSFQLASQSDRIHITKSDQFDDQILSENAPSDCTCTSQDLPHSRSPLGPAWRTKHLSLPGRCVTKTVWDSHPGNSGCDILSNYQVLIIFKFKLP